MDVDQSYDGGFHGMVIRTKYAMRHLAGLLLQETGRVAEEYRRVRFILSFGEDGILLLRYNDDEETYPCEQYDTKARRHTISIA